MAYCPKCGVEVENSVRNCPLCDFSIPDITEHAEHPVQPDKYPDVTNIYKDHLTGIKNQIYFVEVVLLISIILVLLVIDNVFHVDSVLIEYFYTAAIACGVYTYFSLGFHSWFINISGMAVTTALLTYVINRIAGSGWYWHYALPIVVLGYINALGFYYLYKHSKRKRRIGYLPVLVLLVASCLSIGVDGIISWNIHGEVKLTWSLVAAMGCMCVAFILSFVISKIPESTKETIHRKFHL